MKKVFIVLLILFLNLNLYFVKASENYNTVVEFFGDNVNELKGIEIKLSSFQNMNITSDYDDILFSSGEEEQVYFTNNNGLIYLLLNEDDYCIIINEKTIPEGCHTEKQYYEIKSCETLRIELYKKEENPSTLSVQERMQSYSMESQNYPALDGLTFTEIMNEFSTEKSISREGIIIYYYEEGSFSLTDELANTMINELIEVKNYFCNIKGFPTPKTRNKVGNELEDPLYVFFGNPGGGEAFTTSDTNGNYPYICLKGNISSSVQILGSTVHEFFHCIQQMYFLNNNGIKNNHIPLFSEGLAVFYSLKYLVEKDYTNTADIEIVNDKIMNYLDDALHRDFNYIGFAEGNGYDKFLFHSYIYNEYGGDALIKNFYNKLFLIKTVIEDKIDILDIYVETINELNNISLTFLDIYNTYLEKLLDCSEEFSFGSDNYIMSNSELENKNYAFNLSYDPSTGTSVSFGKYGYQQMRFDTVDYSYCQVSLEIHEDTFDSTTTPTDPSIINFDFYSIDSQGRSEHIETVYYSLDGNENVLKVVFGLGNRTTREGMVIQFYTEDDIWLNYSVSFRYLAIGDCLYSIKNTESDLSVSYMIDDNWTVNHNTNLFLKNINDGTYGGNVESAFWLQETMDSNYLIKSYAQAHYELECDTIYVKANLDDQNVSLKCSDFNYEYYDRWVFEQASVNGKIVCKIRLDYETGIYLSAVNLMVGSNTQCEPISNGNIIINNINQNDTWELVPMYGYVTYV